MNCQHGLRCPVNRCWAANKKFCDQLDLYFFNAVFDEEKAEQAQIQASLNLADLDYRLVCRSDLSVRFREIDIVRPFFESKSKMTKEICLELRLAEKIWDERNLRYEMETRHDFMIGCKEAGVRQTIQELRRFKHFRGAAWRAWKIIREKSVDMEVKV